MQENKDAIYGQGEHCYVSQEGIDYISGCHDELINMALTSPVYISEVHVDTDNIQESMYTGYFVDDEDETEIQLLHYEAASHPIVTPVITTPMPVDVIDNYFESKGQELGALVDRKQKAYGNAVQQTYDVVKVFMKPYQNTDGSYTIPESLLLHLLLQVRIIDKQNRIFNNPSHDLMDESPYGDLGGYSLLGQKLSEKLK